MFELGIVEKIAGPVVVAKNLLGSQMYELVKVGEAGLIGEIIRVEGDRATIQVYEETIGIKPGEKVERTGKPLSVELGPGIVGQIYDGIQRPLSVLRENIGAFIRRGVTAPALDRRKKWLFKPLVKEGDKVCGGDVLGEVQETVLVTHRIIVPPELSGTVKSIVDEGEYTVTDDICGIDTGRELIKIQLMHTWPVRKPRPFKRKVPANTPLVTGQRIIDFFFPIAKGGTAAIPGGFGTGKCVVGETPVLLSDGTIRRIKDLFKEQTKSGVLVNDGDECYVQCAQNIGVFSFGNCRLMPSEATLVYEGRSSKIVSVTTRSGRHVKVTPTHRLQVFNSEGAVEEKPAGEIKPGMYLVTPRRINVKGRRIKFSAYQMLGENVRCCDQKAIEMMIEKVKKLRAETTLKEISHKVEVSYDVFINYWLKRTSPTLGFIRRISELSNSEIPVRIIKGEGRSKPLTVPNEFNEDFAEFLGLLLSDSMIKGNKSVYFYNKDDDLLSRFKKLANILFGLSSTSGICKGVGYVAIHSTALVKFLKKLGIPARRKSRNCKVPDLVLMSDAQVASAFLNGYIAGGGSVSRGALEIGTRSEDMCIGLSYLLTRLGILHRIERAAVKDTSHYRIFIEGEERLKRTYDALSKRYRHKYLQKIRAYLDGGKRECTSLDIIPLSPSMIKDAVNRVGLSRSELEKAEISVRNYIEGGEKLTLPAFKKLLKLILKRVRKYSVKDESILSRLKRISKLCDEVFFDEVVEVTQMSNSEPVYDVSVPSYHNFIGGFGPLVLHNTVMQHQLSQWAEADIVVYVGCGERGNEMAEVLERFPRLEDPRTGQPLMARTILVANTSNMPIAAREASVYTGITMAEYFRDMGYDVALMADSTSRWAEALREISGRLEEMPGEEGYPAYLASKIAEFYERAGRVEVLGSKPKLGSISVVGAVSPPGADFSEPVTQNTLRMVKVFWALDKDLAERRHFPAINWLTSYSLYLDSLEDWFRKEVGGEWPELRREAMYILQRDEELREIVMLVGPDALSESQKVILEAARMIKEDFLMQQAYHPVDSYCSLVKTFHMIRLIIEFYKRMRTAVEGGVPLSRILELPVKEDIARMKLHPVKGFERVAEEIYVKMTSQFNEAAVEFAKVGGK